MRDKLLNKVITLIKDRKNYDDVRISELKYGLYSMYTLFSKLFIFTIIAFLMGILKEYIIFIAFYNFLRMYGCGFHANSNFQCWLFSLFSFIVIPLISIHFFFNKLFIISISVLCSTILIKYSPADTSKKPIISRLIRRRKKILMFITCLIYLIILIFNQNRILDNLIMFSLIVETTFVSPIIYKIFKQTYNNYKYYKFE